MRGHLLLKHAPKQWQPILATSQPQEVIEPFAGEIAYYVLTVETFAVETVHPGLSFETFVVEKLAEMPKAAWKSQVTQQDYDDYAEQLQRKKVADPNCQPKEFLPNAAVNPVWPSAMDYVYDVAM